MQRSITSFHNGIAQASDGSLWLWDSGWKRVPNLPQDPSEGLRWGESIVKHDPPSSGMISYQEAVVLCSALREALMIGIPGDVVELGCGGGTSSVYLRRTLDISQHLYRNLVCYDSFEGVGDLSEQDYDPLLPWQEHSAKPFPNGYMKKGDCASPVEALTSRFNTRGLDLPEIVAGDITHAEFPPLISFAFLDMDLYQPTLHGLKALSDRLNAGATVLVHDFEGTYTPGIEQAIKDILEQDSGYSFLGRISGTSLALLRKVNEQF